MALKEYAYMSKQNESSAEALDKGPADSPTPTRNKDPRNVHSKLAALGFKPEQEETDEWTGFGIIGGVRKPTNRDQLTPNAKTAEKHWT
jgi:hypothetical protein